MHGRVEPVASIFGRLGCGGVDEEDQGPPLAPSFSVPPSPRDAARREGRGAVQHGHHLL